MLFLALFNNAVKNTATHRAPLELPLTQEENSKSLFTVGFLTMPQKSY